MPVLAHTHTMDSHDPVFDERTDPGELWVRMAKKHADYRPPVKSPLWPLAVGLFCMFVGSLGDCYLFSQQSSQEGVIDDYDS